MTASTLHPLATDYLERVRRAGQGLPNDRLRELLLDIQAHLAEAIAPEAHNAETLTILDRLGEPEEIIAAAWTRPPSRQPRPPTDTTPPSPHQLR
jgi:uncharacterized membrane protein